MSATFSRRLRILPGSTAEKSRSLVVFRLRDQWFALPIESVLKVVPLESVYGDPSGRGIGLTRALDREILVIDVGRRIFGEPEGATGQPQQRYLVVLAGVGENHAGLPIDSPPSIRRVAATAFVPLPETYLTIGNIQCLASEAIESDDRTTIFLLDSTRLLLTTDY